MESVMDIVQVNASPRIVAIIPAHNEERFIGSVVLKTRCFADVVVVIDDGDPTTDDPVSLIPSDNASYGWTNALAISFF